MERETWLLWLLADSQLPTGGFVASAGLEAAMQARLIRENASETDSDSFIGFIRGSTYNQARFALPFCSRAHEETMHLISRVQSDVKDSATEGVDTDAVKADEDTADSVATDVIDILQRIDDYHQTMLSSNSVAMRASTAQGGGLLTLFNRGYAHARFMDHARGQLCVAIAKRLQRLARLGEMRAHWPVIFGFVCAAVGISIEHTQQLFMFQFVRQIFSAAIRLNLVGPLRAQALQCDMQLAASDLLEQHAHLRVAFDSPEDVFGESAVYTEPVLELYQGMHDRLYSRIFNS
ncbi:hypothetical protein LPJ77_002178 [Coemansia sp. RSA 2523]|nr:hypothetical protein LPJ54_001725 [Coemansia sp. RSA 1824]KAJ1808688.1 hypothetical protein LPJ77_002178 [Coemansia sp. RSA 2523]KAJ2140595.1 hypothetical protein J3F82_005633 [Coemansia sp. RSA 637]KAJ2144673.1 hypothetical protein IW142_003013 [Coemansia sp. RSA 564]KAJ2164689.1 hypothetical protein GGH15_003793 [Coemansia sp. RSA 562]KAJ2188367.1 hypothetical protein EV181_002243 [Coemansia sp. RSA 532]KAJ2195990.1 hypothetical protein IW144_003164 [Coemansia sp. RSA 522]KAJ2271330.1 h